MPAIQLGPRTVLIGHCVFLDASFLVSCRASDESDHAGAKALMAQCLLRQRSGQVELWLSPIVVGEAWWAMARYLCGGAKWDALGRDDRKRVFREYQPVLHALTRQFTDSPFFRIAPVEPEDVKHALSLVVQPDPSLLPWDAYHVATAQRVGADTIISKDRDFRDIGPIVGIRVVSFATP